MNDVDDASIEHVRSALRFLYGGVAAQLAGDTAAVRVMVEELLPGVPLADVLEAGVLSVAEQLRDIAGPRGLPVRDLLRVLVDAHTEMAGVDVHTVLLRGADAYLRGEAMLWQADDLCALAACPTATLESLVALLAASVTWRARDLAIDPGRLVRHVCLGLATREVGLVAS